MQEPFSRSGTLIDCNTSLSTDFNYEPKNSKKDRTTLLNLLEILKPNTKSRLSWFIITFFVTWYNAVMTPIRIFIMGPNKVPEKIIFIGTAIDIIFVLDAIFCFYMPYIDNDTRLIVTSRTQIRKRYLNSTAFYLNIVSCVPVLEIPFTLIFGAYYNVTTVMTFEIIRMTRLLHFQVVFDEFKNFSSRKGPINVSVFRMVVILFCTQLFMCIFGSIYFGLSSSSVADICPGSNLYEENLKDMELWITSDNVIVDVMDPTVCESKQDGKPDCNDCPHVLFFLRSVYFLMQTLFTIGYGDAVVPTKLDTEVAVTCLFMLFGVFGYGLIIANMTSVLSNIDVVNMRFRHEMDSLHLWLKFRSAPASISHKIDMCFHYLERTQYGVLDQNLFEGLPNQLTREITKSNMVLLERVPFINPQYRSKTFLSNISLALIRRIYPPSSIVIHEGEKQRELLIVKRGKVDLYVKSCSEVVATLVENDYFGDCPLLFGTSNEVKGISPGFSEILALPFNKFKKFMDCSSHTDVDSWSSVSNTVSMEDPGAKKTAEVSRMQMDKIFSYVFNLKTHARSKKVRNMFEESAEVKVKGLRILPKSPLLVYWDIAAIFGIMFEAVSVPIQLATYTRSSNLASAHGWVFSIHYAFDILFIIDMYLRMNAYAYTTFENGKSQTIVDIDLIRKNYFSSPWYPIDRIAVAPYDVLSFALGHHILFRIPKLIRVLHLPRTVSRLRTNLSICFERSMNEKLSSIIKMFLCSILIIVWSSAGWNALRLKDSGHKSVYWALTTLTTVGYGDLTPKNARETIYAIFIGAVGATFTAGIIANVTSFFHDTDVSEDNIDHKMNCVIKFMENHSRPLEQVKRIREYFEYIEREQRGISEDKILHKALPDHLKSEVLMHITHAMVSKCPHFSNRELGFQRQLMTSLEQRFFSSRSMIITPSLPSDGMYFIKKGTVDLLSETKMGESIPFRRLGVDDYFSEDSLTDHWDCNPYLAVSVTDSELWYLNRFVFYRLVENFLDEGAQLSKLEPIKKANTHSRHDTTVTHGNSGGNSVFFIHPDNYFIQCWFGLILTITIYTMMTIPFRYAFMENHEITTIWLLLDYFGDFILFLDLLIRSFFLAYYDDSHLVTEKERIWRHYYESGKMKWHIASLIPIEVFALYQPILCPMWKLQVWSLFRMNKLFRLLEIPALVTSVESSLAKLGVRVPKNAIRVGKVIAVIVFSAHFIACLFFAIASYNQYHTTEGSHTNWAYMNGLFSKPLLCPDQHPDTRDLTRRYIASLYWSIATLTTVGYGDITAHQDSVIEILFASFVLIIGTATYTLVIALLDDIVSQLDVTSSLYKTKADKVHAYCEMEALPDTLKSKIHAYYDNLWQRQLGVSGNKILSFFPDYYRKEMIIDIIRPYLRNTLFLKDCSANFIAHIVNCISYELYLPGDTLFHEGERCNSLILLYKGKVHLLNSKGVKFKTVDNGVLGETSFFCFEPHLCSAKAVDTCQTFCLSASDFVSCLQENKMTEQFKEYLFKNTTQIVILKESVLKMIRNLKSSKMKKMVVEEKSKIPKGVILPDTLSRCSWDAMLLLQTAFLAFIIPYQISFMSHDTALSLFLIDVNIDLFFLLDIYAKLNKFAVIKDGSLLSSPKDFRAIYLKSSFKGDLICAAPVSFVAFCSGVQDTRYGLLRITQLIRIRHFGKYLNSCAITLNSRTSLSISTEKLRIIQIFIIMLFLCHWFACIFHLIGKMSKEQGWIIADESNNSSSGERYLRSFYWSLYTVTTIGYGSIPIHTNLERIFAMVVMIGGAVVCDAGITAILTSIIHNRDQQSGENSRRIQCTNKYMSTCGVSEDTQIRLLDYYRYDDTELGNINENEILADLPSALREEVIRHFCYDALRRSELVNDFSDGAVGSLVKMMEPYLAIPNENLSVINEDCDNMFVLKRGQVKCIDSSGYENFLPLGTLIGHIATSSTHALVGFPSKVLEINVLNGQGFRTKYINPYIIFTLGSTSVRSSVKKNNNWREQILIKTASKEVKKIFVTVRSWKNGQQHDTIGSSEVQMNMDSTENSFKVVIRDTTGKSAGIISLSLIFRNMRRHEVLDTHERTAVALEYCHLYCLSRCKFEELKRYFELSNSDSNLNRLLYHSTGQPLHKADVNANFNDLCEEKHSACNIDHSKTDNNQSSNFIAEGGNHFPITPMLKDDEIPRRSRLHSLKIVPKYDDGDPEAGVRMTRNYSYY